MRSKLIFFVLLFTLVLAINAIAPESICPGGSSPRSDVIWCADFDQLANCPNGNERQCWVDNFEKFGGTMNDRPSGANLQYGLRIVPSGGVQGQATDIDIQAKEILRMRSEINALLVKHTGQTPELIQKNTDRDFFMTAEEAKVYGIVDEVITTRK